MSSAIGVTPAAASRSRSAGSFRRAAPPTSLSSASALAIGKAILPVAPVIRIFSESSIPLVIAHAGANVKYLICWRCATPFDAEVEAFRAEFIEFLDDHLPSEAEAAAEPSRSTAHV